MSAKLLQRCNTPPLYLFNFGVLIAFGILSLCDVTSAQQPQQNSSAALKAYACYGICVSNCLQQSSSSASRTGNSKALCEASCAKFNDSAVCKSSVCWETCGGLLNSPMASSNGLSIPNVTASYVNFNPWRVNVSWTPVAGAMYVVAWKDLEDSFGDWILIPQMTPDNSMVFQKPFLCLKLQFQVLPVALNGTVGIWSKVATLQKPEPIVPKEMAYQKLVSMLNKSEGIVATFEYGLPEGWDPSDVLVRDYAHAVRCENHQGIVPTAMRVPGKAQVQYVFRDFNISRRETCQWLWIIEEISSKCETKANYPSTDRKQNGLAYLGFNITCKDVTNVVCPSSQYCTEMAAECRPDLIALNASADPHSSSCNSTHLQIKWMPPAAASSCPVDHYELHWTLPVDAISGNAPQHELTGTEIDVLPRGKELGNATLNADTFNLSVPHVEPGLGYFVVACAVYVPVDVFRAREADGEQLHWRAKAARYVDAKGICSPENGPSIGMIAGIVVAIILAVVVVAVVIVCINNRKVEERAQSLAKLAANKYLYEGNEYHGLVERPNVKEKWELDRERLIVYSEEKPLGSGAFGKVFKGKVHGKILTHKDSQSMLVSKQEELRDCTVAVKQCFEYADTVAKSEFRQEIELMKQLGYHPHLVNMLYCITDTEPMCLIVEYCENGDLKRFLGEHRKQMLELERLNIDYTRGDIKPDVAEQILCLKDLVLFSFQISDGLEYLHQKNYIHRDIAARNCLVDTHRIAKVGDFGLCRFVNVDPIYMSKGGKVPIKWMALEALKEFRFTTENDLWSFGVLLFEIITLGGTPYPDVMPQDGDFQRAMIDYLESGRRMEMPDNCPEEMYSIMLGCWNENPEKRPNISEIRERLRKMLETIAKERDDMYLDPNRSYYNVSDAYDEEASSTAGGDNLLLDPAFGSALIRTDKQRIIEEENENDINSNLDLLNRPHKFHFTNSGFLTDESINNDGQLPQHSSLACQDSCNSAVSAASSNDTPSIHYTQPILGGGQNTQIVANSTPVRFSPSIESGESGIASSDDSSSLHLSPISSKILDNRNVSSDSAFFDDYPTAKYKLASPEIDAPKDTRIILADTQAQKANLAPHESRSYL